MAAALDEMAAAEAEGGEGEDTGAGVGVGAATTGIGVGLAGTRRCARQRNIARRVRWARSRSLGGAALVSHAWRRGTHSAWSLVCDIRSASQGQHARCCYISARLPQQGTPRTPRALSSTV